MQDSCDENAAQQLPPWPQCNVFCIHSYAGGSASACGWRGKIPEAQLEDARRVPLCPRCGHATLLPILVDHRPDAHA